MNTARELPALQVSCSRSQQASTASNSHPDIELEPHVSLRHGALTSLLRDIYSRYSLNKCVACVIDAPARIAAATIAASVSIASFAPA